MADPEQEKKQAYLRSEIMNAGYDTELFVSLMAARKEDGANLGNWTIAELKEIVEEFKELEKKREVQTERPETKKAASQEMGRRPPEKLVDLNNGVGLYHDPFPYSLKTQPRDSNELTGVEIKAKIVGTKVVDKGLFSSGYVSYKITTPAKGWSVERRFKEFGELRIELERLHPGHIVPPIFAPADVAETSPEFAANTRPMLQQFLDDLLRHPLLQCAELLLCFLHYGEKDGKKVDDFYKRVKLYSLMPPPHEIEEIKTFDGSAIVALTPEVNAHVANISTSTGNLRRLYLEALSLNKIMESQIERLSETMRKQVSVYREISSHYKLLKQPKMAGVFDTVQVMFSRIDTSYLQIEKMIGEVFRPLNKQLYHELGIVELRVQELKSLNSRLQSAEKKLSDRKIALFTTQEISKWELSADCAIPMDVLFSNKVVAMREILPKDSKECAKIRMLCGFMCNKLSEEFDLLCDKDAGQAAFNVLFTAKISRDTAKEVYTMWGDLAQKYAALQNVIQAKVKG